MTRPPGIRQPRRQAGAAAVEFAVVLPVLLLVLLGTADWGHYFFVREVVVNASREGARAGTLVAPSADPKPQAEASARSYVAGATLDPSRATITASEGAGSVIVEVRYQTGSISGFLTGVLPAEAIARAEMRR